MSKKNKVTFDDETHQLEDTNGNQSDMTMSELDGSQMFNSTFNSFLAPGAKRNTKQFNSSFIGGGKGKLELQKYVPTQRKRYRGMGDAEQQDYRNKIDAWGNGWKAAVDARKANPRQLVYNSRYVDPNYYNDLDPDKWIVSTTVDYDYDNVPDIAIFDKKTGRVKAFNGLSFKRARDTFDNEYKHAVRTTAEREAMPPQRYFFEKKFGGKYDALGEIDAENRAEVLAAYEKYKSENKGRKLPRVTDKSAYQFFVEVIASPITRVVHTMIKQYNQGVPKESRISAMGKIASAQSKFYKQYFVPIFLAEEEVSILNDSTIPETKAECFKAAGTTDETDPKLKPLLEQLKRKTYIKRQLALARNRKIQKALVKYIDDCIDPTFSMEFIGGLIVFIAYEIVQSEDDVPDFYKLVLDGLAYFNNPQAEDMKYKNNFTPQKLQYLQNKTGDILNFLNNPQDKLDAFFKTCNAHLNTYGL